VFGLAASSHAQGNVQFSDYTFSNYYPVVYDNGNGAGAETSVEFGYSLDSGVTWTLVPSSITSINPALIAAPNGVGTPTTGFFQGPAVSIPGYTGGPIGVEILATAPGGWTGMLQWTEPSIAINPSPAGQFTAMPGSVVMSPVPEPSTLALAGLSGFGMLLAFRRKKA
jgi:hypothetical protein